MKQVIYLSLFLCLLLMPSIVLAQNFGLGYGTNTQLGTSALQDTVISLVNVILGVLGLIALVGIVYGGFRMMVSGGSEEKAGGQKIVAAGVIGLIIVLAAFAISQFVINAIYTATT